MELDPRCCDVSVRLFEEFSGKGGNSSDGRKFSEVAAERLQVTT